MKNSNPSLEEWKELYRAADEFKKTKAWEWMWDSDVFGVQNPSSGEIGYCSVMGALGEFFALGVYLGTSGLGTYLALRDGKVPPQEAAFVQNCLMASFEDRKSVEPEDLKIIKQLGLKYRGSNAWTLFRSHRPGYYPWFLNQEEAAFLKVALEQAREVALMLKENGHILAAAKKGHYLVRVPREEGGRLVWENQYMKPHPVPKESGGKDAALPVDEVRLQRIKKKNRDRGCVWEADYFYVPMPIREGDERPFFARMAIFADLESGLILASDVISPSGKGAGFLECALSLLDESEALPGQIQVSKKEAQQLLEPVASLLGIKVRAVKSLKALEAMLPSLFDHLQGMRR